MARVLGCSFLWVSVVADFPDLLPRRDDFDHGGPALVS